MGMAVVRPRRRTVNSAMVVGLGVRLTLLLCKLVCIEGRGEAHLTEGLMSLSGDVTGHKDLSVIEVFMVTIVRAK